MVECIVAAVDHFASVAVAGFVEVVSLQPETSCRALPKNLEKIDSFEAEREDVLPENMARCLHLNGELGLATVAASLESRHFSGSR